MQTQLNRPNAANSDAVQATAEQVSAFVKALGQLIARAERSTNHYQALGLTHTATKDQIRIAYQHAMTMLSSSHLRLNLAAAGPALCSEIMSAPNEVLARIDRAFDRVSQAFSVLANAAKRDEYDKLLMSAPAQKAAAAAAAESNPYGEIRWTNRRRSKRFKMSLQANVIGYDRKSGKWHITTETVDVSQTGATVKIPRRVRHGVVLYLSLPLPVEMRTHGREGAYFSVYALVRRVEPVKDGVRHVGLEFLGEHPPEGYAEKPWAVFQIRRWNGIERRRRQREDRAEPVWIEYLNESMQCIRQESALTENISRNGMRVVVRTPPSEFEMVRVGNPTRGLESFAAVRNRYLDKDGLERLCLSLIDNRPATQLFAQTEAVASAEATEQQTVEPKAAERRPQEQKPAASAATNAAALAVNRSSAPRKILVADDDPPLRKVLGKILTDAGYEVILAEDGQSAVDKARSERPDLVITDALMPKMHGFLACKAIKEFQSPPKVIVLTAIYTKMNYRWEVKDKYGADEMMTKPFQVAELLNCIEQQLAAPAATDQRARAHC